MKKGSVEIILPGVFFFLAACSCAAIQPLSVVFGAKLIVGDVLQKDVGCTYAIVAVQLQCNVHVHCMNSLSCPELHRSYSIYLEPVV